jgi:hypothetical protein
MGGVDAAIVMVLRSAIAGNAKIAESVLIERDRHVTQGVEQVER